MNTREIILDLLKKQEVATLKQVKEAVGLAGFSEQRVGKFLANMVQSKKIYKAGFNAYTLDPEKKQESKNDRFREKILEVLASTGYCTTDLAVKQCGLQEYAAYSEKELRYQRILAGISMRKMVADGELEKTSTGVYIKKGATVNVPKKVRESETRQKIREYMEQHGKVTVSWLFNELKLSLPGIVWTINNMRKDGAVKRIAVDTYVLTTDLNFADVPDMRNTKRGPRPTEVLVSEVNTLKDENKKLDTQKRRLELELELVNKERKKEVAAQNKALLDELNIELGENKRLEQCVAILEGEKAELTRQLRKSNGLVEALLDNGWQDPNAPKKIKKTKTPTEIYNELAYRQSISIEEEFKEAFESASVRVQHFLIAAEIKDLKTLANMTRSDVARHRNTGAKSIDEMEGILKKYHYTFKEEPQQPPYWKPTFGDIVTELLFEKKSLESADLREAFIAKTKRNIKVTTFYASLHKLVKDKKVIKEQATYKLP